jgi:hypothetical protein
MGQIFSFVLPLPTRLVVFFEVLPVQKHYSDKK